MSDNAALKELLSLQSVTTSEMTFDGWLQSLKDHPERADTAAALLVRAIERRGEVNPEDVPERAPYLRMLRRMGIPSYRAFDRVKGSQRTVARIMNHLKAASANGMQLRQALILKGGVGSGKSFLVDAFKEALEGEEIFTVVGCPVHENPINLLTLLSPEVIDEIAEALDMSSKGNDDTSVTLRDLIATAGKPCQHCWSLVFEGDDQHNPNLGNVKVQGQRLSSRRFGIATWNKKEDLAHALMRGSRGIVDLPEMFDNTTSKMSVGPVGATTGSSKTLDDLLEATNDRRIIGSGSCSETGVMPLDAFILGQTNDEAFKEFIEAIQDSDKFTRRMITMNVPYVLSVTEEELAYREFIASMRDQPHFDPMALKLAALLAVISRLRKEHEVDIVTRARMYDGEELVVEKKPRELAPATRQTPANSRTALPAPPKQEPEFWSVGQFWAEAGEDEGMIGLNMSDMLGAVSQVVEMALKNKEHQCISSVEMINFLRAKMAAFVKDPGLSKQRGQVLVNCHNEFLKPPAGKTDLPGIIEREYRRVLTRQMMEVMAPDFEQRASELFERYRLHARAFAQGDREVHEPYTTPDGRSITRSVKVDVEFLNGLDEWMGLRTDEARREFRRSVEAELTDVIIQSARDTGEETTDKVTITWRTLPKLAHGIAAKLNSETAKVLERVLQPEFKLSDEDKKLRREALERFDGLGYCEHCRETALQYFKDYELWRKA